MDPLTATTLVTALTLMEKVNVFYTSAWSALITAGTVALVIVGAVVPTLLSMWQQRTFRIEKATLENLMRSEIDRRIDQTREDLASIHRAEFASLKEEVAASVTAAKNTIDGALKSLQEKQQLDVASIRRDLEEESAALRGMISHLLAKEYVRRKEYMDAASNTFDAAHLYAQGRSETNLQRSIAMLLDDALPGMTNADVDAGEIDKKYSMLEQAMKPLNENGRYSDHLSRLRKAIAAAKKRLPVSKSE